MTLNGYPLHLPLPGVAETPTIPQTVANHTVSGVRGLSMIVPAVADTWRSWSRGLLTNLVNPKISAFYLAVLPRFIPAHHLGVGILLGLVHDIEGMPLVHDDHLRCPLNPRTAQPALDEGDMRRASSAPHSSAWD